MSTALVTRLFRIAGTPAPTALPLVRALARSPRSRLLRIVAWCAWESGRGTPSVTDLLEGLRVLSRGWDDYCFTTTLPSGAALVNVEEPGEPGVALVKRRGRMGRGWSKENLMTRGAVRPEVELGVRWLGSVAGCVIHEDCAANPELALACASSSS